MPERFRVELRATQPSPMTLSPGSGAIRVTASCRLLGWPNRMTTRSSFKTIAINPWRPNSDCLRPARNSRVRPTKVRRMSSGNWSGSQRKAGGEHLVGELAGAADLRPADQGRCHLRALERGRSSGGVAAGRRRRAVRHVEEACSVSAPEPTRSGTARTRPHRADAVGLVGKSGPAPGLPCWPEQERAAATRFKHDRIGFGAGCSKTSPPNPRRVTSGEPCQSSIRR
jgi:hypothetical protein